MTQEVELEKTYLVKHLPENIDWEIGIELVDIYYPIEKNHSVLRLRRKGNKFEMTKKFQPDINDASIHDEHTIELDESEYLALSQAPGKKLAKTRYVFEWNGVEAELDVFKEKLEGLVLVDFEFKSIDEMNKFVMPDFCLADVTQEEWLAGGMLCGKEYGDIDGKLKERGYGRIYK